MASQGTCSGSSRHAAEKQGQITRSDDEDLVMMGGDFGSCPGQVAHILITSTASNFTDLYQQSFNLNQRRGSDQLNSDLESDFESLSPEAQAAIARVSYGRPTATLAPATPKKRASGPLRELAAFNKDPVTETGPSITGLNPREAHNTRRFVRTLNTLAAGSNTPMPPPENLNWKRLEDEQLKVKRSSPSYTRSTSDAGSQKGEKNHGDLDSSPKMSVRSRKISEARKDKDANVKVKHQSGSRAKGSDVWSLWMARKDQILNLIRAPSDPDFDHFDEEKYRSWESKIPDSLNVSMQDNFFVFAPTAAELWNFQNFIAKVEGIIGRKKGFVKIILPDAMKSRYCPPHPTATASSAMESSSNEYSASIRPYKTKLELLDPLKSKMMIYRVCMLGGVSVLITEWQEAMRKYQKEIMRRSSENPFHVRDEHEEVLWNPCNEKELIADCERASDDMYYAADIQESHSLRHALQLGGPYLRRVHGNTLQGPTLKELAMDRPEIQLAGPRGSPFGLEMTNHAAYSLNYLHRGAPKRWIIIEPDAHERLEELLYPQVEATAGRPVGKGSSGFKQPTHPPRCDRFLRHQPLYVPKEQLDSNAIAYTELVQYEGDMVITFPFAYYQGFSAGPNVAETIAFGNDRWETIHKSRLYRPCHVTCAGPKGPADPAQAENCDIDQPSPGHVSGHVPESAHEEDDEDPDTTTPESSGANALSDPDDLTWDDSSVKRVKYRSKARHQTDTNQSR